MMKLWRDYLEQYAEKEGDVQEQVVVGAYHSVEILAGLCRILDQDDRFQALIDQRLSYFHEGVERAHDFRDRLINSTFSIYNCLNTLSHQFMEGNEEAAALIAKVDEQVHLNAESGGPPIELAAAALRACFPLLSLVTIALDQDQSLTAAIRGVEKRFASGAAAASTEWERLVNALYRLVEMMQVFALATDPDLRDQINQIATRFKEEDDTRELSLKLRNGFCRLFELGHLVITHVDEMV